MESLRDTRSPKQVFRTEEDDAWLTKWRLFESDPANETSVRPVGAKLHPALEPLRVAIRAQLKELIGAKREADYAEQRPEIRAKAGYNGWEWTRFVDRGELLLETHKRAPMRVTARTYERALAILDALCRAAKDRGFTATLDESTGRIQLHGYDATVSVRISERLQAKTRKEKSPWDAKPRVVSIKVPTEVLTLYVGETWSEAGIADKPSDPLERRLNRVFERVYLAVIRQHEKRREQQAWEEEWEAERSRRAQLEEERRQQEEQVAEERRKRRALLIEAKRWRSAQLIRDYVREVTSHRPSPQSPQSTWATWALQVADELDPLGGRVEEAVASATPTARD